MTTTEKISYKVQVRKSGTTKIALDFQTDELPKAVAYANDFKGYDYTSRIYTLKTITQVEETFLTEV